MTPKQEELLAESYRINSNNIGVDSLGGRDELRHITSTFNVWTHSTFDEAEVMSALITLRKKGMLAPRIVREKKEELIGWDRKYYVDGKNSIDKVVRYYEIPIKVHINMELIVHAINVMPLKPVTRAEVMEYFQNNIHTILGRSMDWDEDRDGEYDPIAKLASQLFPELIT